MIDFLGLWKTSPCRMNSRLDTVFHLLEPDINQKFTVCRNISVRLILPLIESATPFRRKYYQNGAHAGYIMYD